MYAHLVKKNICLFLQLNFVATQGHLSSDLYSDKR